MHSMPQSCLPILCLCKNLLGTYVEMWIFTPLIVYFRTKIWGWRLNVLRNKMGCTILRHLIAHHFYPFCLSIFNPIKEKLWLHYHRLDHRSFHALKTLFASLFGELNVESFQCDMCEFTKHKRVPFSISNKRYQFLQMLLIFWERGSLCHY